jgi:hypothetical protein
MSQKKMPFPPPFAGLNAEPVVANAAKVKSGLFIAMTATGATVGKTQPAVNNVVKTYVLPMPKQVSK